MKFWLRRRHKATEAAEIVEEAKKERDDLQGEFNEAIRKVDKAQNRLLTEYAKVNGVIRK